MCHKLDVLYSVESQIDYSYDRHRVCLAHPIIILPVAIGLELRAYV